MEILSKYKKAPQKQQYIIEGAMPSYTQHLDGESNCKMLYRWIQCYLLLMLSCLGTTLIWQYFPLNTFLVNIIFWKTKIFTWRNHTGIISNWSAAAGDKGKKTPQWFACSIYCWIFLLTSCLLQLQYLGPLRESGLV